MHSKECSRVDNTDKVPAIVDLGTCPETGARIYDLHQRRELFYSDREVLEELTGRSRFEKSTPRDPHPTWTSVAESTKTDNRPNGIKGSTKLIRQCKCPCMKKIQANFCSCSICERARDALRRYDKLRAGWRSQAENKRKLEIVEARRAEGMSDDAIATLLRENPHLINCNRCNRMCHDETKYRAFSSDLSPCLEALLCDKVRVPNLDLPKLDDNFRQAVDEHGVRQIDRFSCYREECSYSAHVQLQLNAGGSRTTHPLCGWDAVFSDMPLHERTEKDTTTSEETNHYVRACPDEYDYRGNVTWMDFQKVSFI